MFIRPVHRLASLGSWVVAVLLACGGDTAPQTDAACAHLASGHACTWLGLRSGEGFNGDGLHRVETAVYEPQDLVFLPDQSAWFTDFNNFLVRRVRSDGYVETMVGSTSPIFPGDGPLDGIVPGGAAGLTWLLNHPTNLVLRPDGNVLVVAWHNHKLLKVNAETGVVDVECGDGPGFAGDGMPAATFARFKQLNAATYDDAGNLYVLDQQNGRIRKIDAQGIITTIAGDGTIGHSGDGGPASQAQFSWERGSNPNPSGGLLHHAAKLYVSDTQAHAIRVIDLATGMIDGLAGTGVAGAMGDGGPARLAQLNGPRDLEIGPEGDLYFADTDNAKIRAINLATGTIRTVAGSGELGLEDQEGLAALQIKLRRPFGIEFDASGNLYIMDSLNSRIVKVAR
jgi:DNA-binding beta-propeller fold protein YncE